MHETGCSGLVHWDDPGGWDGEGGERRLGCGIHVHPWLIHVNVWQKPLQYWHFLISTMDNYGSVNVRFLLTVG